MDPPLNYGGNVMKIMNYGGDYEQPDPERGKNRNKKPEQKVFECFKRNRIYAAAGTGKSD
jgi:hypothetical protein